VPETKACPLLVEIVVQVLGLVHARLRVRYHQLAVRA
jgi:hypothetical protein